MKATKFLAGIIAGLMTIGSVPCYRQNISDSYLTAIAVEKDPDILYGDVNQDGEITVADSVIIQNYDLYPEDNYFTEQETILADVNFDGEVNILDAARISAYLLGNSEFELASDEKDENWDSSKTLRLIPTTNSILVPCGQPFTIDYYVYGDFDLSLIQGISGRIDYSYYCSDSFDISFENSNVELSDNNQAFNKITISDSLNNYVNQYRGLPIISITITPHAFYGYVQIETSGFAGNINGQTINISADNVAVGVYVETTTTTTITTTATSKITTTTTIAPPTAEAGLAGDASGDNKLDIADVVILASYVGNPEENPLTPEGIINGDVHNTGDGITSGDVLAIQQYLAQIIKELPV